MNFQENLDKINKLLAANPGMPKSQALKKLGIKTSNYYNWIAKTKKAGKPKKPKCTETNTGTKTIDTGLMTTPNTDLNLTYTWVTNNNSTEFTRVVQGVSKIITGFRELGINL